MISACLIVRDEEEILLGCLESIADFADEIIVVDTGSVDKTMDIARSFDKVRLFQQRWESDFSKARNYSIEQAKGDWIFIIDADERLNREDVEGLSKFLKETEAEIVSMGVWNHFASSPATFLTSIRLFRAKLNLRYEGIVHNQLVIDRKINQGNTRFRIDHLGYDLSKEKMEKKFERSRDLIEKQIEKDPKNAYALMNLAQLYRSKDGKFNIECAEPIIETCSIAADLTNPRRMPRFHVHLQAMDLLAWTLFFTGKVDQALSHAVDVLKLKEDFLDTIFLMGFCHYEKQMYDKAFFWFNHYMEVHGKYDPATQYDNVIFMYLERHPECFAWMGKSALHLGQYDKAVNCLLSSLKLKPTMNEAYETLEVMYSRGLINDNEMNMANSNFKKKLEKPTSYYDDIFAKPYETVRYEEIYKAICALVFAKKDSVLEVGCGTGVLAKKLIKLGIKYRGFDFSKEAVSVAGIKNVTVGDTYREKQFRGSYDTVVAVEVLEHVRDLKVLSLIPEGKRIILTIPNFDDPAHLRVYRSARHIIQRFGHLIDIVNIEEFNQENGKKIFLVDGIKKESITKGVSDGVEENRLQV